MNGTEQRPKTLRGLAAVISGALLTIAGPGMAHQPPGAENVPEGITRATIAQEGDVSAMSAMVMDAPQPALLIRYKGEEPLIVYDSEDQPFLRFTGKQVKANTKSRYWQALPQSESYDDKRDEHWVQVSGSGNFGWVDPRITAQSELRPDQMASWRIPVKQGKNARTAISGNLTWRPLTSNTNTTHH
ncbi:MAG: hypothetical protein KA296_07825 [Marinobacter sp.]|nr:hypothetical protein [Marinobacter sp.]